MSVADAVTDAFWRNDRGALCVETVYVAEDNLCEPVVKSVSQVVVTAAVEISCQEITIAG